MSSTICRCWGRLLLAALVRHVVCVRAEDINISGSLYRNKLKYANFRRKHMSLGRKEVVFVILHLHAVPRFHISSQWVRQCSHASHVAQEHQSSSGTFPLSLPCQDPLAHHSWYGALIVLRVLFQWLFGFSWLLLPVIKTIVSHTPELFVVCCCGQTSIELNIYNYLYT